MRAIDLFCLCLFPMFAVTASADDDKEYADESFIRNNPEFEADGGSLTDTVDISKYPFVSISENFIRLNGTDWSMLADAFSRSEATPVRIVHIGDSHVQADMSTGYTRRLLQNRYGSAGRGLIVPLEIAGTNEPQDYSITSTSSFSSEKLLKYPWSSKMGFTGVSLTPMSSDFDFRISASEAFERMYIYYHGNSLNVSSVDYNGSPLVYAVDDQVGCIEVGLPFPCEEITVSLSSFGEVSVYGMELVSDMIGVVYHSIGINGATYMSYGRVEDFGRSIAMLEPRLIIVSLGTNEAFGRLDVGEFEAQIDRLVNDIRTNNPQAGLMLVTPAECQRRLRRRRGSSYAVNDRVATVRETINRYGREHGVAVYDWYEVAGGKGSSTQWIKAGLFSRDRIHYSRQGYELSGYMLYEAIVNSLNSDR